MWLIAAVAISAATPLTQVLDTIRPGDPRVRSGRVRSSATTAASFTIRDGASSTGPEEHKAVTLTPGQLLIVTENRDGSSARIMALDTVILDPVTLAPRRHTSHNSVRAVSIRYEGERVLGTITNRAGAVSAVDTTLASPGFDQGTIDVVLSTLPLEAGARWVLPVVELQRLTWQPVSVTEVPLEIDGRTIDRTWRVVVGEDRGQSVYWFDAADRRLLRRELIIAPTMVIRHDVRS